MTRFLVVPQWQGSASARAMLLIDGASAIAGDLPRASTVALEVPLEAGEALDTGVHRLSSLLQVRAAMVEHEQILRECAVVIGGDCSLTVFALSALDTADLAVLWCDAHPDLHDPDSSPSGAFSGMALRAVLGEGEPQLALAPGVPHDRVILVGTRSIDAAESAHMQKLPLLTAEDVQNPDAVLEAVRATGAARVWVHIDVDVLDPSGFEGVSAAVPFGVDTSALVTAIKKLRAEVPLAGATIAGFAPRSPDDVVRDMGAVLRLIGALA